MKEQNPAMMSALEISRPLKAELSASLSAPMHKAYHEMNDVPVVEMDALSALEENVRVLADLQARLSFMNRELRYLLKAE